MARTKSNNKVAQTGVNAEALQGAAEASVEQGEKYQLIAQQFNYALAYNRGRMVDEVRHYMGESARAMLEAGARLALIRSQEPHGEWLETCEQLNLEPRTAQRMINSALKFANATTSSQMERLGTSKLIELLVLDDDDASTLAEGGAIAGLGSVDDIASMTVRELRTALREAREDGKAKDAVLSSKNKKIDNLETQLQRKRDTTPAGEWKWAPLRRDLLEVCEGIANTVETELRRTLSEIAAEAEQSGEAVPDTIETIQQHALITIMQSLVGLQSEYGIAADLEEVVTPPWLADAEEQSNKNAK
ncbi:MAG: hypothetical protein GAK35_02311 [Herbaspirillum frisingense]|uniref:DUF3102 domain-containing protein n=1 Tax=Herbaspirillum frisingense TaxID=92645 RepID=A0A7V8FWG0_9BURK|nr:MAG: hypothetical protein GAK35_02311 [Herbaspirillum frisingense]